MKYDVATYIESNREDVESRPSLLGFSMDRNYFHKLSFGLWCTMHVACNSIGQCFTFQCWTFNISLQFYCIFCVYWQLNWVNLVIQKIITIKTKCISTSRMCKKNNDFALSASCCCVQRINRKMNFLFERNNRSTAVPSSADAET